MNLGHIGQTYRIIIRKESLLLVVLFTVFTAFRAEAQGNDQNFLSLYYIEGQVHSGFVIQHHPEMLVLTDGFFPIWEFSLIRQTTGKSCCHYLRNFPQIGITYRYNNFGGSEYLGVSHALMPFLNLQLSGRQDSGIWFRIGLGAGLLTKKFNPVSNYRNLAIGSHLNAAVEFQLFLRRMLNRRVYLKAAVSMMHLSNGTIQTPNYGLNMPSLSAGLGLKLNNKEIVFNKPDTIFSRKGRNHFRLMASTAVKQIYRYWDEYFAVYIIHASLSHYYNHTNEFQIGLDAVYDESTRFLLEQAEKPAAKLTEVVKLGVSAGHGWSFERVMIWVNLGYYLRNPYDQDDPFYNRLGISYDFSKHVFFGLNLQAHWAKAEFLSAGLGVKL